MRNKSNLLFIILIAAVALLINLRCRQPYISPAGSSATSYLVVNGTIDTWGDTCVINLSRTVKLTDSVNSIPELNAVVSVQGNDGTSYALTETGRGNYAYPDFSFLTSSAKQYRLNIVTSGGKTYQSDFVPVKNSPPIDSVYYTVNPTGIQLFSNTHDGTNNSRYYRWDYDETWVVRSYYDSYWELKTIPDVTVVQRSKPDQIDSCWISGKSSTIILNSSAKLSKDIITDNPVGIVGSTSEKLTSAYSILLHQYALTEDAFNYWQNLKKNTEQLGSIFDAQPSQIVGNIHCITNPSELVIGYISAGADSRKRLFVYKNALPYWQPQTPFVGCGLDTVLLADLHRLSAGAIPVSAVANGQGVVIGYDFATSRICVDCTLRGTNQQPSYWISK